MNLLCHLKTLFKRFIQDNFSSNIYYCKHEIKQGSKYMKKILRKFFKENILNNDTPSAAALAHMYLSLESNSETNEKVYEAFNQEIFNFDSKRKEEALIERTEIENAKSPDQIIRFMRRHTDPINQHILVDKALEYEDEIVPEIVNRLKTSMNDGFIETAIRILAKCNYNAADEVIQYYNDMRSPYAQSMALVLLGFIADEKYTPWFIEQYNDLKRLYPNENYSEGAYYGLV